MLLSCVKCVSSCVCVQVTGKKEEGGCVVRGVDLICVVNVMQSLDFWLPFVLGHLSISVLRGRVGPCNEWGAVSACIESGH